MRHWVVVPLLTREFCTVCKFSLYPHGLSDACLTQSKDGCLWNWQFKINTLHLLWFIVLHCVFCCVLHCFISHPNVVLDSRSNTTSQHICEKHSYRHKSHLYSMSNNCCCNCSLSCWNSRKACDSSFKLWNRDLLLFHLLLLCLLVISYTWLECTVLDQLVTITTAAPSSGYTVASQVNVCQKSFWLI